MRENVSYLSLSTRHEWRGRHTNASCKTSPFTAPSLNMVYQSSHMLYDRHLVLEQRVQFKSGAINFWWYAGLITSGANWNRGWTFAKILTIAAFLDVIPCTLEEVYRDFSGFYCCLHHRWVDLTALVTEAPGSFETSVHLYRTELRDVTHDNSSLRHDSRQNLRLIGIRYGFLKCRDVRYVGLSKIKCKLEVGYEW